MRQVRIIFRLSNILHYFSFLAEILQRLDSILQILQRETCVKYLTEKMRSCNRATTSSNSVQNQTERSEPLQFNIECLQRENVMLHAEVGRNYGPIRALETASRNVKTDNERQCAELGKKRRIYRATETVHQHCGSLRA
jgi:hypothetical protein